jgi:hypothetical protein
MQNEKPYNLVRFELFVKSYVGIEVIKALRRKLKIPSKGLKNGRENYVKWVFKNSKGRIEQIKKELSYITVESERNKFAHQRFQSELLRPIHVIAISIKLNPYLLEEYILTGMILKDFSLGSEVRMIFPQGNPIIEPGIYIQVFPNTKREEVISDLEFAKAMFKKFFSIKEPRQQKGAKEDRDIENYLLIEKNIQQCIKDEKSNKSNLPRKKEDELGIVRPAIVLILEDKKLNTSDQEVKKLQDRYYRLKDRYRLPRLCDLQIYLQLISS